MSQCQQILHVLSDGREYEMRDIHRAVGFCRLNSRVAELRSRGHEISCRREGQNYFYRLLNEAAPTKGGRPSLPERSFVEHATAPNPPFSSLGAAVSTEHTSGRDGAGVLTLFGDAA